jgi:glycosyltransferase involved in cell wall biosynthesis
MKILLVGNYQYDGSTSMQIWARALERDLLQLGIDVRLISPPPVFGRFKPSASGVGKWLGYIDRYVLFPRVLRAAAAGADVVHMCDHGSAMYCSAVNGTPVVVTCNDMLAVRGALGELPEMASSRFGRYLQLWICNGLRRATRVACISQATFDDAARILDRRDHLRVVLDALNYPYRPLPASETDRRLASLTAIEKPFLLHVGSNHARKNRDGILRAFAQVAARSDLQLLFAGEALNDNLLQLARQLGVEDRIVQVVKPDVSILEALYNRARVLIFPSRYEGFGWPPIEAQACGCPVVASDIPPVAEVLRSTAAIHRLDDESGMAASILRLHNDEEYRDHMRQLGFENIRSRFQTSRMMNEYVALYGELAREAQSCPSRAVPSRALR